jgi:hypothetical protein
LGVLVASWPPSVRVAMEIDDHRVVAAKMRPLVPVGRMGSLTAALDAHAEFGA